MAAITPITPLTSIQQTVKINSILTEDTPQKTGERYSFADMLKAMLNNVNETDALTKTDAVDLAMGFTDMQDLHNIEINAIRADLALRTMTSVRNKVLEAYSEVMRITI
ncbi:MAG: flagellar hook-basal body complex protein FliE [Oscillospiraceae bacterium]|nr:flagellar hook-basal body complex protein FliE [Oscillospiraceae bacterium]